MAAQLSDDAQLDRTDLEAAMRTYYQTYYAELRRRMSQYPLESDIFPDYLVGARQIVAVLGEDGVMVTHWPAERDSFEFRVSEEEQVREMVKQRAIVAPNGMRAEFIDYEPGTDFGAFQFKTAEAEFNGRIIRPDWIRLDCASALNLNRSLYNESKAEREATKDVLLSASAYVMGLDKPDSTQEESKLLAELGFTVEEFKRMLASNPAEGIMQKYLGIKRNRILLHTAAKSITPEVSLGSEYRADFVIGLPNRRYILVEIERPQDELYTKAGDPAYRHKHGQQQIEDWIEWLDENKDYARKNIPALKQVKEPEYWLVIGRRGNMSEKHRKALARKNAEAHRIRTLTFDDLLEDAQQHLNNLRGL